MFQTRSRPSFSSKPNCRIVGDEGMLQMDYFLGKMDLALCEMEPKIRTESEHFVISGSSEKFFEDLRLDDSSIVRINKLLVIIK